MKTGKLLLALVAIGLLLGAAFMGCESDYSSCTDFNNRPHNDTFVSVGDSMIALSSSDCTNIVVYLSEMINQHWDDYSVSGEKIDPIIDQYRQANSQHAVIDSVLLDAGGNDTLQGCTDAELPLCDRTITYAAGRAVDLVNEMQADGVQDIIWFGYYNLECGGDYAKFNEAVEYGMDMMLPVLDGMGVYTVDLRLPFRDGNPNGPVNCSYVGSDGLHPSSSGSYLMAEEVYDTMVANGIIPEIPGGDPCAGVISDKNRTHQRAGRAYKVGRTDYYAVGSDEYLGGAKAVTALLEESAGYWIRVPDCET
jgi:hypothetical protein